MFSTNQLKELIKSINEQEHNLVTIIKHFTKSYTFKTNKELKEAVKLWNTNKLDCLRKYGHISDWDVSLITNMSQLFYELTNFNDNISRWDVSNVTTMYKMYDRAISFNQPLNDWNVSNVTNMYSMFSNAKEFNQPLNNWNVLNVIYMTLMFY